MHLILTLSAFLIWEEREEERGREWSCLLWWRQVWAGSNDDGVWVCIRWVEGGRSAVIELQRTSHRSLQRTLQVSHFSTPTNSLHIFILLPYNTLMILPEKMNQFSLVLGWQAYFLHSSSDLWVLAIKIFSDQSKATNLNTSLRVWFGIKLTSVYVKALTVKSLVPAECCQWQITYY